jgi:hypothetical protein
MQGKATLVGSNTDITCPWAGPELYVMASNVLIYFCSVHIAQNGRFLKRFADFFLLITQSRRSGIELAAPSSVRLKQ